MIDYHRPDCWACNDNYVEWDGTEERLYELLIWWGTRKPYIHAATCEDPKQLHCCDNIEPSDFWYGIQGEHEPDITDRVGKVYFVDNVLNTKTIIEIGDRIYFRGHNWFELVKNAKD